MNQLATSTLPVKRRPNRKDAETSTLSEAVRKTWKDADVAAARRARHGVSVQGTKYRSVRDAFEQLGLPSEKHIAFRLHLKAKGRAKFGDYTFVLLKAEG